MSNVRLHISSFNAGELSPLLGARFAVEKVAAGCRMLRNFLIHTHGPAFRRPGMEHMGRSAGNGAKSSLRGFNFSTSTGAILEFHPSGLQVWSNGQLVPLRTEVALPYNEAECAELQIAQVNDVCYITHPNHPPRRLVRYSDDDWRLEPLVWKWPALGDENVRAEEITTPTITLLSEVPTYEWPEFRTPSGYSVTFSVVGGDTTGTQKKAKIFKWNETQKAWIKQETLTWTTILTLPVPHVEMTSGSPIWRMTYEGPVKSGSKLRATWSGGSFDMPLDTALPLVEKEVTVPAGEWQTTVTCPATVPSKVELWLQKKTGTKWENWKQLTIKPGQVIVTRQKTLTTAGQFRFKWTGRAMTGGTAKIEKAVYPPSNEVTLSVNAVNGDGRTMTASEALFQVGHIGSFWQICHRRETAFTQIAAGQPAIDAATSTAIRVAGKWDVFTYGTWNTTLYLEKKISGVWEVVRSWSSRKDRNVIASGEEEQEVEMRLRVEAGASEAATGAAVPRFVLEAADARVYGLVQITAVGSLDNQGRSKTATVNVLTTLHATAATSLWTEGAWSGVKGYPRTVALHGQRLWFGGTRSEPLRVWGSVVNDYQNFRRSSLDDASVSFTAAAQQSNALQWMVSHGQDLILGTTGDEWTLSGGTDEGPITPTSVQLQRRSGYGSAYLGGILLGEVVVFVQRGGRKLRQVAPRADGVVWSAADLTVLAEHVAKAGVVQIAVMNFPYSVLWAVTTDGQLLGMTFEQEQNVFGWHVHNTDGLVESVAVVFGVESDEVWLQVRRNGERFIERLDPLVFARQFDRPERLIYLDAATRFESDTPVTTITGLNHLEGRDVSVMGDGAELSRARVNEGTITVESPVSVAVVGLPFTSELQPMRVEIPLRDGTAQHRRWRTSRVGLSLHESIGGEVADAPTGRFEKLPARRVSDPMDTAPALVNGYVDTAVESTVRDGVDVTVRTSGPHPLNVGSITFEGDVYG